MNLKLLTHILRDDYHPFYLLSTKTKSKEIELDGYLEYYGKDDVLPFDFFHEIGDIEINESNVEKINKDWLIRAKRNNSEELQYRFYRIDKE